MADDGLAEVYKQPDEAAEEKAGSSGLSCKCNFILADVHNIPVVNSFRDIFHIPGEK